MLVLCGRAAPTALPTERFRVMTMSPDPTMTRSPLPRVTVDHPRRSARLPVEAVQSFDLAQELAVLQQEPSWQHGDRNARTLVEAPGLRVVLTVLKVGAHIREPRT